MTKVAAAILIHRAQILIGKRKHRGLFGDKWEFPGGKVEDKETVPECLRREMKEEFGIHVQVAECLGQNIYRHQRGAIWLIAHRVLWKSGNIRPRAHSAYRWVSAEEIGSYDFCPPDALFVRKVEAGEIA